MKGKNTETAAIEQSYLPEGQRLTQPVNLELTSSLQGLERAMHTGIILEGLAYLCDGDLNLHIDFPALPEVRAIIPPSEAVYSKNNVPIKDIAILTRVGKAVCFKVMGMSREGGIIRVTLSRRAAQAECMNHYLSTLCPGDIIPARVTHMESFGAFVDIGCGISSLLSVDTISVSRISHPRDRLYNGQCIHAVVKTVERDHDGLPNRIFISTRELLGTWLENAARFRAGETVVGIVRSVEPYGVFVELTPNLTGLAELKEVVDNDQELRSLSRSMVGRRATVFIKSILPEKMKIKLVLIDVYKEDGMAQPPMTYTLPADGTTHISRWHYSPEGAKKQIRSDFDRDV